VRALETELLVRVLGTTNGHDGTNDQLLTAEQVAERLGCSVKALYKRTRYPFEVHDQGKTRRWSEAGLEAWIRRQQRRGAS
jgi:predicted DNA-binding transcriptional regulator AlpA